MHLEPSDVEDIRPAVFFMDYSDENDLSFLAGLIEGGTDLPIDKGGSRCVSVSRRKG
jgi:hypothetical protein